MNKNLQAAKKILFILQVLVFFGGAGQCLAQTIKTVAGRSYLGDNRPATNASLPYPYAMVRDSAGNIYVATEGDNRIRKINATTQVITTYAGQSTLAYPATYGATYGGDSSAVINANFNFSPFVGLGVDKKGNLYVGDYGNNRIRKIDVSTGIVTTIAGNGTAGYSGDGGPATQAEINGGEGIAVDAAGNIFFADNNNSVIRRIDATTRIITTVAGLQGNFGYTGDGGPATSAAIGASERVMVDAADNLYIPDEANGVVRKVNGKTGIITTIAGTGVTGYTGDGGLATNAKINPMTVNLDGAGNIYIDDQNNGVIRKISAQTGIISTIAGTGKNGYNGNGKAATGTQFDFLTDVDIDAQGNIYVDDLANNRIRLISSGTNTVSNLSGDGTSFHDNVPALTADLFRPWGIAFNKTGNLYIADATVIRKYTTTDTVNTYAGGGDSTGAVLPLNAEFYNLSDVVCDSKGNVYAADQGHGVFKVDALTKKVSLFAGGGTLVYPANIGANTTATQVEVSPLGLTVDASDNVYISDENLNVIWEVNPQSNIIKVAAGGGGAALGDGGLATKASLSLPWGIATDAQNNLYICDGINYRIREVNATTKIITTIAGTGVNGYAGDGGQATAAKIGVAKGIIIDSAGNIYITDGNNRVRKITKSTGVITTIAGNGAYGYSGDGGSAVNAELANPNDIKFDQNGHLFVADGNNFVIREITGPPPIITSFSPATVKAGDTVIIKGKYFTNASSVAFGGTASASFKIVSDSLISAVTGNGSSGSVSVTSAFGTGSLAGLTFCTPVTPMSSITANTSSPICAGTKVNFTATSTNGGTAPTYQWYKDNKKVGSSLNTYTDSTIQNGDSVWCVVTSNSACVTVTMAKSNVLHYTVKATPTKPTITQTGSTSFCLYDSLVLTANAATGNALQWYRDNGAIKLATNNKFTVKLGGSYMLKVTGSDGCSVTSNAVTASVTVVPTPTITLVNDTLVSSASTGNQWFEDGALITGATSPKYSPDYIDVYTVQVTSAGCTSAMSSPFIYTAGTNGFKGKTALLDNVKAVIYPNPAQDAANLKLTGFKGSVLVTVTDMAGKVVWQQDKLTNNTYTLPTGNLASGTYIVTIKDRGGIRSLKLVKAK